MLGPEHGWCVVTTQSSVSAKISRWLVHRRQKFSASSAGTCIQSFVVAKLNPVTTEIHRFHFLPSILRLRIKALPPPRPSETSTRRNRIGVEALRQPSIRSPTRRAMQCRVHPQYVGKVGHRTERSCSNSECCITDYR
jgi:hypothetical protein